MQKLLSTRLILGFAVLTMVSAIVWAGERPVPVSPSGGKTLVTVDQRYPTFIWGDVPGARNFELAVYEAEGDASPTADLIIAVEIPGSAQAWVPPVGTCLEPGSKYAWTVRAVGAKGPSEWSEPSVFAVSTQPSFAEVEEAFEDARQLPWQGDGTRRRAGHPGRGASAAANGFIRGAVVARTERPCRRAFQQQHLYRRAVPILQSSSRIL